jgi:hypothetical protein
MTTELEIPSTGILVRIMPPDSSPAASQAPPPPTSRPVPGKRYGLKPRMILF